MGAPNLKFKYSADRSQEPVIVREPNNQHIRLGARLSLCVIAKGNPSYQWFKNGQKIPGAVGERFIVAETKRADAGVYSCELSNAFGSTTTRAAHVSFIENQFHQLTLQPSLATIPSGHVFSFQVESADLDLSKFQFQWLFNGKRIRGATAAKFEILEVKKKHEGEYKALIIMGSEVLSTNTSKLRVILSEKNPYAKGEIISAQVEAAEEYFFNPERDENVPDEQHELPQQIEDLMENPAPLDEPNFELSESIATLEEPLADPMELMDTMELATPEALEPAVNSAPEKVPADLAKNKKREALEKMLSLFSKK